MLLLSDPRQYPLRSSIVIMAITASIALVMILSGLSAGVRYSSRKSLEEIGVDLYVVPEDLHPLLTDLQRFDQGWSVQRELEMSEWPPDKISPRLSDALFYEIGRETGEVQVVGIDPSLENDFNQFKLIDGNWFSTPDDPVREEYVQSGKVREGNMTLEVMLSKDFMDSLRLKVGDTIILTPSLKSGNGFQFRIEGTYIDSLSRLSRSAIIHLGELQYMKGLLEKDTLSEILIGYENKEESDGLVEWSATDEFPFRDIVDIMPTEEVLEDIQDFLLIIDGFAYMVIGMTLVICLIFTSTIFIITAKERSRDTAILRAIGISSLKIIRWVIIESGLFYAIGSISGLILGSISIFLLNNILESRFQSLPEGFILFRIEPTILMAIVLSALVISVASSLMPALRIVNKPPMEALRGDVS
mgnify:CR=1 FL=1